jgi:ATP-binding cassette subfamily B protein
VALRPLARFVSRGVQWLRPYRGEAALIALGLVLEASFTASVPLAFRLLIDRAIVPRDTALLMALVSALAVGVVLVAAAGLARDYLYARVCSRILRDLRAQMFDHMHRLSPDDVNAGVRDAEAAHFSTDLAAIEHAIVSAVPWALLPALDVLVGTALLFLLDWQLALIAVLVFPLSLVGPRFVAPRATRASYERKSRESDMLREVQENLDARRLIRAFGLESSMRGRFSRRLSDLLAASTRTAFLGALVERSAGIGILLLQVVVIGVGALMTFDGRLTIGTLVAFQTLFMTVSWSLSYVTQYVPNLVLASGGWQRIDELLAAEPLVRDRPGAHALPGIAGEIRFDHVVFGFPGRPPILNGLDLSLTAGERVAIVGPVGSGKSTVLRLLGRLADPDAGRVLIDGVDLREVTQQSLRGQIGLVFQDTAMVDASIRDSIRMGKPGATDSEVEAVASLIGLHRLVEMLPCGYDTMVGSCGEQLSGGQRQLVAIARAVIRDPAILLLDEPTSALDAESDQLVRLAIDLVSRGRTVVAVTHRLSLAIDADRVFVLEEGRLAEQGSHDDLLAAGTVYSRLWQQHLGS